MKSADGRFEYCDRDDNPLAEGSTIGQVGRFRYRCRKNASEECSVNIVNAGHKIPKRSWTLTGSFDAPTLAPSINCTHDGVCWHGYIEGGVFKNAQRSPEPQQ